MINDWPRGSKSWPRFSGLNPKATVLHLVGAREDTQANNLAPFASWTQVEGSNPSRQNFGFNHDENTKIGPGVPSLTPITGA